MPESNTTIEFWIKIPNNGAETYIQPYGMCNAGFSVHPDTIPSSVLWSTGDTTKAITDDHSEAISGITPHNNSVTIKM